MKTKKTKMNKKGIATIYIIIFVVLVLLFVGYAMWDRYQKGLKENLNPNQNVVIIQNNSNVKQPEIKITSKNSPNKILTPGVILTMDSVFICNQGYLEKIRNVPESLIEQVFKDYKIKYPPKNNTYVIDHWIALEVGGSNDKKNLWPQPYEDGQKKNKVEKYLYSRICNRTMNMSEAQSRIKNWTYTYQECCAQ
jgi:hypothetical protein